MTEEARRALNAYRREWARKNPDKVKAMTERYWEKKAREQKAAEVEKEREDRENEERG